MALLDVNNLNVTFQTDQGVVKAVDGVSFFINPAEAIAIVGESKSGKSQTAFAIMGLLARNGTQSGEISFEGKRIDGLPTEDLNRIRAAKIGMIFQDPMTSLNPYLRISEQMAEVLVLHKGISWKEAESEAARMLDAVRIPEARARLQLYPHEFSGGMRQRIMIAMALLCRPKLLIADEPTTALDITVQAQILDLLNEVRQEFHTAIILITHDLGIVAGACSRTLVMYGGQMMESGETRNIFARPTHPYTKGLLNALPRLDADHAALPIIEGEPPNMTHAKDGCPFALRCANRVARCSTVRPVLTSIDGHHLRACHIHPKDMT